MQAETALVQSTRILSLAVSLPLQTFVQFFFKRTREALDEISKTLKQPMECACPFHWLFSESQAASEHTSALLISMAKIGIVFIFVVEMNSVWFLLTRRITRARVS